MDLVNQLHKKLMDYFGPKQQSIISPLADQYGGDYIPNQAMAYALANHQSREEAARQARLAKIGSPTPTAVKLQYSGEIANSPKQVLSVRDQYVAPKTEYKANIRSIPGSMKVRPSSQERQFSGKEPIEWDNFVKLLQQEASKMGYDWQILAKQKALESTFGTSEFARERNNFGGIGAYDSDPDQAFAFDSPREYIKYYDKMVKKRFPEAYKVRNDPKRYIEELKKGGYATDPEYVWKVMNTPLKRGSGL